MKFAYDRIQAMAPSGRTVLDETMGSWIRISLERKIWVNDICLAESIGRQISATMQNEVKLVLA